MVLLAHDMENSIDFRMLAENFMEAPAADTFVNLHEDFYQMHKFAENKIEYTEHLDYDSVSTMDSYSKSFKIIEKIK